MCVCSFGQTQKQSTKIAWNIEKRRTTTKPFDRNPIFFSRVFFLLKLKSNKWLWIELKAVRKKCYDWPPFFMSSVSSGCGGTLLLLSPATNPIASNPKQIKNIALLLCILQNFCTSWDVLLFFEIWKKYPSLRCRIWNVVYRLARLSFLCGISFGFIVLFLFTCTSSSASAHNQQNAPTLPHNKH